MAKALTLESFRDAMDEMKAENKRLLARGETPLFIKPTHVLWPVDSKEVEDADETRA